MEANPIDRRTDRKLEQKSSNLILQSKISGVKSNFAAGWNRGIEVANSAMTKIENSVRDPACFALPYTCTQVQDNIRSTTSLYTRIIRAIDRAERNTSEYANSVKNRVSCGQTEGRSNATCATCAPCYAIHGSYLRHVEKFEREHHSRWNMAKGGQREAA